MFERFTERARQVIVVAQDESRALKHDQIGSEHVLLGLLAEKEGAAARVLDSFGVELDDLRRRVAAKRPAGAAAPIGQIPFTPRAKKALEFALREALSLGHNYIGTEHILLGLLREPESGANEILSEIGLEPETVRGAVIDFLSQPAARPAWVTSSGAGARSRTRLRPTIATAFEHKVLGLGIQSDEEMAQALDEAAAEGWELVSVVAAFPGAPVGPLAFFKRRQQPGHGVFLSSQPQPQDSL